MIYQALGRSGMRPLLLVLIAAVCFCANAAIIAQFHDHAAVETRTRSALDKLNKWASLLQDFGGNEPAIHQAGSNVYAAHVAGAADGRQFYTVCTAYRTSHTDAAWLRESIFAGEAHNVRTFHMSAGDDLACFLVQANPTQATNLMGQFSDGRVKAFFPVLNEMKLHDSVRHHILNLPKTPESTYRATGKLPDVVAYFETSRHQPEHADKPIKVFQQIKTEMQTRSHIASLERHFPSLTSTGRHESWAALHSKMSAHAEQCNLESVKTAGSHKHLRLSAHELSESCLAALVLALSSHPEVIQVTYQFKPVALNNYARGIVQVGDYTTSPYTTWGLTGANQIVAIADDGLDDMSCFFIDDSKTTTPRSSYADPVVDYNRRKVIEYISYADAGGEVGGHGTHTSGSLAGQCDDSASSLAAYNGQGQGAKLTFYDIGVTGEPYLSVPADIYSDMLLVQYNTGARIHSDSWGSSSSFYDYDAQAFDEFLYDYPQMTAFIAAGNSGQDGYSSVGSPATGKNVVSVGAGENDHKDYPRPQVAFDHNYIAYFSSVGPLFDNRLGIDIVAPGFWTFSANGSIGVQETCSWIKMAGTSMATPTAAGTAATIRQYFSDANYWSTVCRTAYTGCKTFTPSGVLIKTVVLHSGSQMQKYDQATSYGPIGPVTLGPTPDIYQGYGLLTLANVLPATGVNDGLDLFLEDLVELASYQYTKYTVNVANSAFPLKVTVAWYDPHNSVFASKIMLHDLDLIVVSPSGVKHLGNSGNMTGGYTDEYNPNEQVYVENPATGSWIVYVASKAITESPTQKYSITVTSGGTVVVSSRQQPAGTMFDDDHYCGTDHTVDLSLFDYDANGWDGKRFLLMEPHDTTTIQTAEFTVVNSDAFPQVYNTMSMCVKDNTCYYAYLDYTQSTTSTDISIAVEIPECNVYMNPWIRKQKVCWVDGVCNGCNATDTQLELTLSAYLPESTGWGMNYYTIFTDVKSDDVLCEPDALKAAGTMEWNVGEAKKTHCLPNGDYIIRLQLNDPHYFPIVSIPLCGIYMHTTVPSLEISEGSVSYEFTIHNGKCYVMEMDDDMMMMDDDDGDDSNDISLSTGGFVGLSIGVFAAGGLIIGGLVYFLLGRSTAGNDSMKRALL